MLTHIYTVESVTKGHPDKVCDQISDALLDAYLAGDLQSRVAIESFGSHGKLLVAGEVTSHAKVLHEELIRKLYKDIGYEDELAIRIEIKKQSPEIAHAVDTGGAGDQGIMYGYATDETPEFLPRGVVLAHALARKLVEVRKEAVLPWAGPDGKTQITMEGQKVRAVLVSTQHSKEVTQEEIQKGVAEQVIAAVLGDIKGVQILVNPTGHFVLGGFQADTGLTGRKIMVDSYGGLVPHGGGCFSGKDPTKVDRSGAYMARYVAKNMVAGGHAKQCLVSVAYAIGRADPLMVEAVNEKSEDLSSLVKKHFDFRPLAIIERLGLRRPIYGPTAVFGHFGREGFPWEEVIAL
jgi:S-adenosylmethionine synthetase